jgi:hypothetical protein
MEPYLLAINTAQTYVRYGLDLLITEHAGIVVREMVTVEAIQSPAPVQESKPSEKLTSRHNPCLGQLLGARDATLAMKERVVC